MNTNSPMIVLALGGNAISPPHAEGNIPQQFAATRKTAALIVDLIKAGYRPVITHGNGPQVGNVLRRVELAAHEVYTIPLQTCVADTQGGMGYMIAECLDNELGRRGIDRAAATIITMVEVGADDPDFAHPTKPIGGYYTPEKAEEMVQRYGWQMVEIFGRGMRRVVPSPRPRRIVEVDLIRRLAEEGELIITAGGGGIPVVRDEGGALSGVEAVIDKDRTSALLAAEIAADMLVIATEVSHVALNFGQPDQQDLDTMNVSEARRHLAAGQFPPGSMGPKIEAAIDFLERRGDPQAVAIVAKLEELADALAGRTGTWIRPDDAPAEDG